MKRSVIIFIPIAVLAFSLNFLPTIDTKINSVKDATVYTVCSFQSDDKKCTFCHNDIIKHDVMHGPVVDDCESCHQSTGNKHPKAKSEGFTLAEKTPHAPPRVQKKMAEQTPLKRLALPIDVAKAVLFYATDLSDFVTGNCLSVDGGKTMR